MQSVRAFWLVVATSIRVSPWQALLCLGEAIGVLATALNPFYFGLFAAGAVEHHTSMMVWAVVGLVVSAGLKTVLQGLGNVARLQLAADVAFAFDLQIADIIASIETLDHLEVPDLLDRLQILRDNEGVLGGAFNALLNTLNNLVWAGTSIVVAVTADWRLILLALLGLPRLLAVRTTLRWDKRAEDASGSSSRLAQALLDRTIEPQAGAETRIFGLQNEMQSRIQAAIRSWREPLIRKTDKYALLDASTGAVYFSAASAVIGWIIYDALHGSVAVSALVVALTVISAMQNVSQTLINGVRNFAEATRNAGRFLWLKDYATDVADAHPGSGAPPEQLQLGIELDHLSYRYQAAATDALSNVTLKMPAGSIIALVGENGAGKSTLVKLLAGLHRPTSGRILIDGADLIELDVAAWRSRMSGAFQDHANLEFSVQRSVGVGDLHYLDDPDAVRRALSDAAAEDVLRALPNGLATQLGTSWPNGVELSGGQWQRVALGRGMMRANPLLLVLDEPTSALDATTEHALFERYIDAAHKARRRGAITLLVTHRFSTVAAADIVVVLDHGRIVETGTHAELIAADGHYAELYELQARGYR